LEKKKDKRKRRTFYIQIKNMKKIKENCLEFLQNEDIRRDFRDLIRPIIQFIYNEIYIYLWVICFYNVFIFFLIVVNMYLLIRLLKMKTVPSQ